MPVPEASVVFDKLFIVTAINEASSFWLIRKFSRISSTNSACLQKMFEEKIIRVFFMRLFLYKELWLALFDKGYYAFLHS
ncbi:hypothetical protein ASE98_01545 [Pseudomonas sp. Leaf48]|nr:hypothetical protein ASE98_01545 [Pseudomonas sp. Leaf48]